MRLPSRPSWKQIRASATLKLHNFLASKGRVGRAILFLLFMEDMPAHLVWGEMKVWKYTLVLSTLFMVVPLVTALNALGNTIWFLGFFGNLGVFAVLTILGTLEFFHIYYDRPR